MGGLVNDLRFAIRMLLKNPSFSTVIVLTLGLGIGAITAIFSVIHAVVLRPLPFDDPDRLVLLGETHRTRGERGLVSYPNFVDWQERNTVFKEIAAYYRDTHTLTGTGIPEHVEGARVTAGFFPTIGVKAAIGRLFSRHDDVPGSENVAVLSNGLWQRCFGGEPGVIGRTVVLDGTAFTVIGVLPSGTIFPKGMPYSHVDVSEAEVWTPFALVPGQSVRGWRRLQVIGRLKADVSPTQAQADMDIIAAQLERQYPADNTERGVELSSLHGELVANVRPALWLLFGAVGLVLLIACTNVANLLLARGNKRRKELAVRAAMGAGRFRLVRQLISESVLFAVIGGALGVLLASWSTDGLVAAAPFDCPQAHTVGLNWHVLGFTLVVSVIAATVFGIAPAILGSRVDLRESLGQGGGWAGAEGRVWLRGGLVIGEISLALMLLVGAGLLVRSLHRLTNVDPGFDPDKVLTFRMTRPWSFLWSEDFDPVQRAHLYGNVIKRIESLPSVKSAGGGLTLPLVSGPGTCNLDFSIVGRPEPPAGEEFMTNYNSVSLNYFQTLGIPLLRGRSFTERDTRGAPGVVIINEAMARRYWPGDDPIGQFLRFGMRVSSEDPESWEIIGIVADVRDSGLDTEANPFMYVPCVQQPSVVMEFAVRTAGNPLGLVGAVRSEVAALTTEEAAYGFSTMDKYIGDSVGRRRFATLLLGIFAGVALLLATLGIYAMLSYSVAQRTHEIGMRMAIGAQRGNVIRLVLKQGLTLTAIGLGIGLAMSLASTRVLSSMLYEVSALDLATFISVPLLLAGVAALACYIPARRATKVDPMAALRCE